MRHALTTYSRIAGVWAAHHNDPGTHWIEPVSATCPALISLYTTPAALSSPTNSLKALSSFPTRSAVSQTQKRPEPRQCGAVGGVNPADVAKRRDLLLHLCDLCEQRINPRVMPADDGCEARYLTI